MVEAMTRTAEEERADVVAWFRKRAADLDRMSRDSAQGDRRWGYHERAEILEDEANDIEAGAHVGTARAIANGLDHACAYGVFPCPQCRAENRGPGLDDFPEGERDG
jgi:hypothetical protein